MSSSEDRQLSPSQSVGFLVLLFGVIIILIGVSDIQKEHPWWLFWIPGLDVIGIVAGLYLTFAGLVVVVVPEDQRGEAVQTLLRALEMTLRVIVILTKATVRQVAELERRRRERRERSRASENG